MYLMTIVHDSWPVNLACTIIKFEIILFLTTVLIEIVFHFITLNYLLLFANIVKWDTYRNFSILIKIILLYFTIPWNFILREYIFGKCLIFIF